MCLSHFKSSVVVKSLWTWVPSVCVFLFGSIGPEDGVFLGAGGLMLSASSSFAERPQRLCDSDP